MKYYEELLEKGCFNREDLAELTGSKAAAQSLIYDYQRKKYIERVKRNLYVAISLETKQPVCNRYQIGSRLFEDACISHHSAFEVYGYANQVFYECYVATESRFTDFEYNGVTYHRIEKKPWICTMKTGKVTVTSLEQTVVDSIRDFDKIAGLEEIIRCLMLVPSLRELELLKCLKDNDNGFLYQKCGYIFQELKEELKLSDEFYKECKRFCPDSKRYLMKEEQDNVWNENWGIYTPSSIRKLIDKGVTDYDAI
ncbi:MAG: transcriptional regulator [bacterium]|nr:transcriptional regulator [bacterium]